MGAWEWIDADLHDVLPNLTSNSFTYTLWLFIPARSSQRTNNCTSHICTYRANEEEWWLRCYLLIEGFPERRKAEMVCRLLHMLLHLDGRCDCVSGRERCRWHLVVPRRAAATATIPPMLLLRRRRSCCHGSGGAPVRGPAALPGLCLVEDLAHHQLPLLLLF